MTYNESTCRRLLTAVSSESVTALKKQIASRQALVILLCVTASVLLVIWIVLMCIRYKGLRYRASRLCLDLVALFIALGSCVMLIVTQTEGRKPVGEAWRELEKLPISDSLEEAVTRCKGILGWPASPKLDEQVDLLSERFHAINVVTAVFAIFAAGAVLTSIISAIIAGCVKAPPVQLRAAHHARQWQPPQYPTVRTPPSLTTSFFMRFLHPIKRNSNEAENQDPEGPDDCGICLEPLKNDLFGLTMCSHEFHKRCILKWLTSADKPCCPICKQPVRIAERWHFPS